jgi:hypothetical protein
VTSLGSKQALKAVPAKAKADITHATFAVVASYHLLSTLLILFTLVCGLCWQSKMHSTLDFCQDHTEIENECHSTDIRFASFLSCEFITVLEVNPPERKLAKGTSVHSIR